MSYRLPAILALLTFVVLALVSVNHHLPFDVSLSSGSPATAASAQGELTLASLTRAIAEAGANVEVKSEVLQPFFSVRGTVLSIANDDVQVFEYRATDKARGEAAKVSADGSTISNGETATRVEWVATPHFFQRDRLIVVYVGNNEHVLDVLEDTLGAPYAGAGRYRGLRALIP